MRHALIACVVLMASIAGAFAAPARLTDNQLDAVTAGMLSLPPQGILIGPVGPPTIAPGTIAPGGWLPPVEWPNPPPNLPIVNPGGPILISCTIGVGCTSRPY